MNRTPWSSDRALRHVARELGVNHETPRNWVRTAERAEAAAQPGGVSSSVSASELEELRALRKRMAELELEKEILRKAAAYFAKEMGSLTRSYRFISEHDAPARAGRAAADERLAGEIAEVHAGNRGACGRPRIVVTLRRRGRRVNHKRVERIMRERGITGITQRRCRSLTRQDQGVSREPCE